jgi:hypothetical protein
MVSPALEILNAKTNVSSIQAVEKSFVYRPNRSRTFADTFDRARAQRRLFIGYVRIGVKYWSFLREARLAQLLLGSSDGYTRQVGGLSNVSRG